MRSARPAGGPPAAGGPGAPRGAGSQVRGPAGISRPGSRSAL